MTKLTDEQAEALRFMRDLKTPQEAPPHLRFAMHELMLSGLVAMTMTPAGLHALRRWEEPETTARRGIADGMSQSGRTALARTNAGER